MSDSGTKIGSRKRGRTPLEPWTKEMRFHRYWTKFRQPPTGQVYFVMNPDNGHIKIGYTGRGVFGRILSIQTGHSRKLVLAGAKRGAIEDEREIHALMKDCRIRGEWFAPTKELHAFIIRNVDIEGGNLDYRDLSNYTRPIPRNMAHRLAEANAILEPDYVMPTYPLPLTPEEVAIYPA